MHQSGAGASDHPREGARRPGSLSSAGWKAAAQGGRRHQEASEGREWHPQGGDDRRLRFWNRAAGEAGDGWSLAKDGCSRAHQFTVADVGPCWQPAARATAFRAATARLFELIGMRASGPTKRNAPPVTRPAYAQSILPRPREAAAHPWSACLSLGGVRAPALPPVRSSTQCRSHWPAAVIPR
jgi:cytochrome c551/c552